MLLWGVTIAIILGTAGLAIRIAKKPKPEAGAPEKRLANVAVQEVKARPYSESLILPARLEADRSVAVSSELAGRLERWLVEEGATVTAGQALAELNDDDLRAKLAELEVQRESTDKQVGVTKQDVEVARVALEQTKRDAAALQLTLDSGQSELDFAQRESARVNLLAQSSISTQAEVDRVKNQLTQAELAVAKAQDAMERAAIGVRTAEARVAQGEAGLELAKVRVQEVEKAIASLRVTLAKTHLVAPFAGRFDEHLVEVGQVVSPGQPLGRIYDVAYLRVAVDVPDRYAPFLDANNPLLGQYLIQAMPGTRQELKATVQIPGLPKLTGGHHTGVELPAKIARVAEAANDVSHTFRVELRFANPGGALREGMIVRAEIDFLTYDKAIVIPLSAIQVADVGPRVLVLTEEEDGIPIAHVRDVVPVSIRNDQVLVQSGLASGESLIVAGGKGVLDGERVRVVMADGVVVERADDEADSFIQIPPTAEPAAAAPEQKAGEPAP